MLEHFPSEIRAGLNLRFNLDVAPTFGGDWSLRALLRGAAAINIDATWDGSVHVVNMAGAETSEWLAGRYEVSVRATRGAEIEEIENGFTTIIPDLAAIEGVHDPRAHAEKVLESVEAVLEGRASKDQQSYTINGRTLVRTPMADLLELRSVYKKEVARHRSGGKPRKLMGRKVRFRF